MYGRALSPAELQRLQMADLVATLTRQRDAAKGGWVTWSKEHPEAAGLLEHAAVFAIEDGLLSND